MRRNMVIIGIALCLLGHVLLSGVKAQCGGSCGACTRRYGCMTPAWGKCCTHFFMQNGKRSAVKRTVQRLLQYTKLRPDIYPRIYKGEGDRQKRGRVPATNRLLTNLFVGEEA